MNQSIEVLKNWFSGGKKPTGKQFADLIDSCYRYDLLVEYSANAEYWHSEYDEGDIYIRIKTSDTYGAAIRITGNDGQSGRDGINGKDGADTYAKVKKYGYSEKEDIFYGKLAEITTDSIADETDIESIVKNSDDFSVRIAGAFDGSGKTEKTFTIKQLVAILANFK